MKGKRKKIGFIYAWNGLKEIYKTEFNFRIHLCAAILVIIVSVVLQITLIKWAIVMLVIAFVLVAEIINSAVEKMIDFIKPEYHPVAGVIKDVAAAAVLLSAIFAVIIGIIIFLPELYEIFIR
ncbi:diacylglycerol kinase [Oceanobacillus senegalensis]|uniref:diacylglycerol kinase n=1 Tax=Oceanobacillus senegalensis TaxID=1936063 RepID=UPI001FEC88B4|nr:diacylglycerol kinase [Oceanobacillus senegalensis]